MSQHAEFLQSQKTALKRLIHQKSLLPKTATPKIKSYYTRTIKQIERNIARYENIV
jgi:hypothetical protein